MNYIIIDLEWNNSFYKAEKRIVNEIIEIGAVKLDESLQIVDEYSTFISPVISKKVCSHITEVTHITNEDIAGGISFSAAMSHLGSWIAPDDIVMTWSNTDIRVFIENCKQFGIGKVVPFLTQYADLQKYCQSAMGESTSNQMGLSKAAEALGINLDEFECHRALDDCRLSAECFKRTFNADKIKKEVRFCDDSFYKRLSFKAYYIVDINNDKIDRKLLICRCDRCGKKMTVVSPWRPCHNSILAEFECASCGHKVRKSLKVKQCFDRIVAKEKISVIPISQAKAAAASGKE